MRLEDTGVPCVVVATGGCWGNILAYLRSLGRQGVRVYLVGVGCDLSVAEVSRYCAGFVKLAPGEDKEVVSRLLDWRRRMNWEQHPVLYFVSERLGRMFCLQRALLEEGFIVPMPEAEVLGTLLQKHLALNIARDVGLLVPKSWTVTSGVELLNICDCVIFPAVIKPLGADTMGRINYKASIVTEKSELQRLVHEYWVGGSRFVVQNYIPGDDSKIWVYLFYKNKKTGEIYEWTGRKLRQSPQGAGIMARGMAEFALKVAEAGRSFVDASGYWGIGGVEFKEHGGALYFIEMNPRSENFQAMAIADGVDFPVLAYAGATGQVLPPPEMQRNTSRYLDGAVYLGEMWSGIERVESAKELFRYMFQRNVVFPVWRSDDPYPFILSVWSIFLSVCKRVVSALWRLGVHGKSEINRLR